MKRMDNIILKLVGAGVIFIGIRLTGNQDDRCQRQQDAAHLAAR
jgi:hypothetical protein